MFATSPKFSELQRYVREKKKKGQIGGSLRFPGLNESVEESVIETVSRVLSKQNSLSEITRRIALALDISMKSTSAEARFFDNFLVIGINPNTPENSLKQNKAQPEILYSFSDAESKTLKEVPRFCFPRGIQVKSMILQTLLKNTQISQNHFFLQNLQLWTNQREDLPQHSTKSFLLRWLRWKIPIIVL